MEKLKFINALNALRDNVEFYTFVDNIATDDENEFFYIVLCQARKVLHEHTLDNDTLTDIVTKFLQEH